MSGAALQRSDPSTDPRDAIRGYTVAAHTVSTMQVRAAMPVPIPKENQECQ